MTQQAAGTGLAVRDDAAEQALANAPTDQEIEGIRKAGGQMVAYRKEVNAIFKTLEGLEWGTGSQLVKGSNMSQQARYALAEFLRVTRANPILHLDVLGNKPYLNANYWVDKINSEPSFHHYDQRDLSPSVEEALRERAKKHRELAGQLQGPEAAQRLAKALDLEEEADDLALARAKWSPRPTATCVIETTIWRFMNSAPIERIRSGEIQDFERYLIAIPECNWAGGMGQTMASSKKWDPVGDANPGTTARTRSLRRAAVKSFPAWMEQYDRQIEKAERIIEAEFEVIQDDNRNGRALPSGTGPQAVGTGSGEPSAASPQGAVDLPGPGEAPAAPAPAEPSENGNGQPKAFDASDARKRLFATLRDAGFEGATRKAWQEENNLPESTNDWTQADYERAQELLVGPTKKRVTEGCDLLGVDLHDLSLKTIEKHSPDFLGDWKALDAALSAMADR